jgi:hypothetical protein
MRSGLFKVHIADGHGQREDIVFLPFSVSYFVTYLFIIYLSTVEPRSIVFQGDGENKR